MAVHELQFPNLLRLKNGNMTIKWSDANSRAEDKMQFRITLGRLKKMMEEESQIRRPPLCPYGDKDGRVAALANEIKKSGNGLQERLFVLISTCTPIQYQDSAMAEAAVGYRFVFDDSPLWRYPPRPMTPGELLSSPTIRERGLELIPVTKSSELYALCIAVLREWGFQTHFSYINEYSLRRDIKTSTAAVSIIISNDGGDDLWITAPALGTIKNRIISGVRILDDISFLSHLYVMAADEANRMIDSIITPAIGRILEELGRGEIARDIVRGVPFPTPVGGNTAIKMQGLLSDDLGPRILGKDAYEILIEKFYSWMSGGGEEIKKMESLYINIENALANALELDADIPMLRETLAYILISSTPIHQQRIVQNMERRGHDLIKLL